MLLSVHPVEPSCDAPAHVPSPCQLATGVLIAWEGSSARARMGGASPRSLLCAPKSVPYAPPTSGFVKTGSWFKDHKPASCRTGLR